MAILNTKRIIFISIIFIAGIFWADFISAQSYYCQPEGWAYSDTVGWISFSCNDCPPGDPLCSGGNQGVCETGDWPHYGVKINNSDKNFLDYAWNGYVGWIDFGPTTDFPVGTNHAHQAQLDGNKVNGWARIISLSGSPGGGWISMSCATDPGISDCTGYKDYGVYFDQCEFKNWAWSDDIGWISFNCDTDQSVNCNSTWPDGKLISDFYRVKCGEKLNSFNLNSISLDSDYSCKVGYLNWDNVEGASDYEVHRVYNSFDEVVGSMPAGNCGSSTCGFSILSGNPQTTYSFYIKALSGGASACGMRRSNTLSVTTTVCPPLLTFCPPDNPDLCFSDCSSSDDCKNKVCSQGGLMLQWTPAKGQGVDDGADGGYILYRAVGGVVGGDQGYQKIREFKEDDVDRDSYYGSGIYKWTLSNEDFGIGKHYYFFVRAVVNGSDIGINQYNTLNRYHDVDSDTVDICCLNGQSPIPTPTPSP